MSAVPANMSMALALSAHTTRLQLVSTVSVQVSV